MYGRATIGRRSVDSRRVLLIGAGPSSLAFALEFGGHTTVLEREDRVGGLCRSVVVDDGVFDLGGHSFHTPHQAAFDLVQDVLDGSLVLQTRQATVLTHGALIPYPFQKFFDRIHDPAVVQECREGLAARGGSGRTPANFEEFIVDTFGAGIAKHFMLPYNRKLWARDLTHVACDWTQERVAQPKGSAEEEAFKTTGGGRERRPLQSDSTVGYPAEGGFEEIYKRMAARLPDVRCGKAVVAIDPVRKFVRCADGSRHDYDVLVSSMPLPLLLQSLPDTPAALAGRMAELEFMSLRVEFLLVGRRLDTDIQRIYSADANLPPHKIAFNHNSSPSLRARDRHAIMAEVSIAPGKPVDVDRIAPKTIATLTGLGLLRGPDDVIWTGHEDIKYGYPVYTHSRKAIVADAKAWLEARDIFTIGRFGEWEYINSDACIMKGIALARRLRS